MSINTKVKLFIVDSSQIVIDKLETSVYERSELKLEITGAALNYKMVTEKLVEVKNSDVFLISASLPDSNGIDLIAYIKGFNKDAKFIVSVGSSTRNMVDEAMDRGADDYIQKPFSPRDLAEKIHALYISNEVEEEVESLFVLEESETTSKYVEPIKEEREVRDIFSGLGGQNIFQSLTSKINNSDEKPNKVVTFASPKSNGKTTMLINTAAAIKKNSEYNPKVVLVDLNLIYPSVSLKLHQDDMNSEKVIYDIFDLLDEIEEVDETYLEKCVAIHEPTGVHILNTSLRNIRDVGKVTEKKLLQLIMFLREHYDLVMIDTNGYIRDETTIVPLTLSDVNVILMENELGNVSQTKRFIKILQIIERDREKKILENSIFVVNRYRAGNKLSVENMKMVLFETNNANIQMSVVIPEDEDMIKFSNYGSLIVEETRPVATKINELAMLLYPYFEEGDRGLSGEVERKESFFSRLTGKNKK